MRERISIGPFAILFVIYLVLAAVLPAIDDEIYYWCWSKELQWSYFDHPPMTALLIYLSTSIFGDSVLALRLPACIASTFVIAVISRLTPFKPLVLGVILSPLFTLFAVVMTPDSPLIFCWSAYLWWLVRLHEKLTPVALSQENVGGRTLPLPNPATTGDVPEITTITAVPMVDDSRGLWTWWLLGGAILGLGVLSKYTMGLAVPTGFLSLLLARQRWRNWMPGYFLHGMIAFAVASPILIYNFNQNFEPLLFQWHHVAERVSSSLQSLGDFVGVQVLAFGTMPFCLLPWVCFHVRQLSQNPRLRVCTCLYAVPLAFFLYKSTQTRLEGNWALVCFISFWPIASEWYQSVRHSQPWRWATAAAFLPPLLSVAALTLHFFWPIPLVPVKADRVYRQIALNNASREIANKIRSLGESLPIYTDTYQSTALLRFQSLNVQQIAGLTRPSHFTRPPRRLTDVDRAYVITEKPLPPEFHEGFSDPQQLASIPVIYRGETDRILNIWLYSRQPEIPAK